MVCAVGKTANHAIVLAQLYIRDKSYGLHPFMVQIRSMENHQPMPGITVGEIGPKMGMRAADNGFLKLEHVRIPRDHMLMKNAKITPDGEYIRPKSDKLNYGTMVFVRVLIIDMVAFNIARAATIAIRYSAVRRQSEMVPGKGEVQILDYQAQQYKLLPLLGFSHACKATFVTLMTHYKNASEGLEKGDLATLPERNHLIERLASVLVLLQLHAISSGLKAYCADQGSRAVETCRRACGGHGFLLASGLPRLYATTVAACTYEGENTVLFLQTARYIIKILRKQQAIAEDSSFQYLLQPMPNWVPLSGSADLPTLIRLFRCAAYQHLADVWQAHIQYYIAAKYADWVENSQVSDNLRTVLRRLCLNYLLYVVLDSSGPFLQVGTQHCQHSPKLWELFNIPDVTNHTVPQAGLTKEELAQIQNQEGVLLEELRPDAVALVDAFDFHDLALNSALGSFDGRVYERLYNLALEAPLNKTQVALFFLPAWLRFLGDLVSYVDFLPWPLHLD
ncbi:ACOX2, partial [Cordylochernes scorpioides]